MRGLIVRYLFCLLLFFSFLQAAETSLKSMQNEKRVAFIVGNGDYEEAPLKTAVDDAMKMKTFLQKHNFQVTYIEDASKRDIIKGLRTFNSNMKQNGIALFYFTGHSVQVRDKNYLIPVEAAIESDHHVLYEAIELDAILEKMNTNANRLNIVMLDASHESPFGNRFRAKKKGLAKIKTQKNMDIVFSCAPNTTIKPYPFTSQLLSVLTTKGISNEEGFKEFKKLHSHSYIQLSDENFYFNLPDKLISKEQKLWQKTLAMNSIAAYTAYLSKNPDSTFSSEANANLQELKKQEKLQKQKEIEDQISKQKKSDQEAIQRKAEEVAQRKAEEDATLVAATAHADQQRLDAQEVSYVDPMMVLIKAGSVVTSFVDENSQIPKGMITIQKDFYIGHYEVSNVEYNEYLKSQQASENKSKEWNKEFQPAVNISWNDANNYAKWLSRLTGKKYRLPTENEWEYAARAGATTQYFWGDRDTSHRKDAWRKEYPDNAHNFAWIKTNAQGITHTVGSKEPNPWGLYDILGNVSEWCSDNLNEKDSRVLRGGSWASTPEQIRLSQREVKKIDFASNTTGFRLVLEK